MRFAIAFAALLVSSPLLAADTATLKAQFVYGGDAFAPAKADINKDLDFCGTHDLVNERLLVDVDTGGIQNVVFYVFTGRGGSTLPEQPASNKTHELANLDCRFEPRIVLLQAGDSLKITNPDPVGHNANLNFFNNPPQNITIPPGAEKVVAVEKSEPAPIPVDCNIHPWMRAYVVSLDHPFGAVSQKDGTVEIKGLPAGKLTFRLYVESAESAIREVEIDGKKTSLRRNMLELELKPGVNDLGKIVIPASTLKP